MKLCIAEKPSVAKDIATVIGAVEKKNGYLIGNGYIVTWCIGHLVKLAEPEEYGEEFENRNNIDILPIIPVEWKLSIIEETKKQFEIVKSLMHREDIEFIIDCGDMGYEGHYLQWLVREKAGCKKPVKRFCATSLTDESINKSMANLRDINDFKEIIKGQYARKKADWITGISLSRLYSKLYNAFLTIGRVQTPTLFFVYKRYVENINFKSKTYYQIKIDIKENIIAFYKSSSWFKAEDKDEQGRIINEVAAKSFAAHIKQLNKGVVTTFETKNRATNRPQLYDITELERDGNRIYGFTPMQVLESAQKLYETYKITTYPRTDSRYITSDLEPYMSKRVEDIASLSKYEKIANNILSNGLNIDNIIVDNTKVTDHHAIIVTEKIKEFDFDTFIKKQGKETQKELLKTLDRDKKILHLIITRFLTSFSPKYLYKESLIEITFKDGAVFNSTGKITVFKGFKDVQDILMGKDEEDESTQTFNNIVLNQTVDIKNIEIVTSKTIPPKLHTESTLLSMMENAGATIMENPDYKEILKGHGIGTQATRAGIIQKLFDYGYIQYLNKNKVNYLIPTQKGILAVKIFPKELLSANITAEWEIQVAKIIEGTLEDETFLINFSEFITNLIENIKNNVIDNIVFTDERESIGECLWCKNPVYEGQENYYCSSKDCNFSVFKDNVVIKTRTKKNLTKTNMKNLLKNNSITLKCISASNNSYDGNFSITKNDKGYASIVCTLPSKNKK